MLISLSLSLSLRSDAERLGRAETPSARGWGGPPRFNLKGAGGAAAASESARLPGSPCRARLAAGCRRQSGGPDSLLADLFFPMRVQSRVGKKPVSESYLYRKAAGRAWLTRNGPASGAMTPRRACRRFESGVTRVTHVHPPHGMRFLATPPLPHRGSAGPGGGDGCSTESSKQTSVALRTSVSQLGR